MSKEKELTSDFLAALSKEGCDCDLQIAAFKILPLFMKFLRVKKGLVPQPPIIECKFHQYEVLESYYNKYRSSWDNSEKTEFVVVQRCQKCGNIKTDRAK